jgi:hypothetical protein
MKRIILSRKGFDSSEKWGKKASPIFSNGNICSIPIPADGGPSDHRYRDLSYEHVKIEDVFEAVKPESSLDDYCHFDPQLNQSIGLFGQANNAQSELTNRNVGPGDVFLFFGWFSNYSIKTNLHHLFGWLQIDHVLKDPNEIKDFLNQKNIKHPHGYAEYFTNNALYVSKEFIEINNKKTSLKGFGMFKKTNPDLILTAPDRTKSIWKMPEKYFSKTNNLFMNRLKWEDEKNCLINSGGIGQEFVMNSEINPNLIDWVMDLIKNHGNH